MKAAVVYPGHQFSTQLRTIPDPQLGDEEVLVRVLEVGIDGTDRDIFAGEYGEAPKNSEFLVIGHESIGQVVEVGKDARTQLKKGDLVVATVRRPDGCPNCQVGQMDMCLWGDFTERGIKGRHGYLSEYYSEKPEYLVPVPKELKEVGVLLEPFSVVEKAISQAWKIQERMLWKPKLALVLGAGPIGILATAVLRLMGLRTVVFSRAEPDNPNVQFIKEVGAEYISSQNTRLENLKERLGQIDFILEATGNGSIAMHSIDLVGVNGVVALTSVSSQKRKLEICADCSNLSLVLGNRLVFGSVNAGYHDFESGLSHAQEILHQYPEFLHRFVSRVVPFEDYRRALDKIPGETKVLVRVST
jgi:threonine dehydrogenase-like Zn-dependent dehydrogenase